MSLSQVLNNLNTSETSETMEAASLKEPSSSLESARPFPEILDVSGFSIINFVAEFNQMTEKHYQRGSTVDVIGNICMLWGWWAKSNWQSARQRLLRKVVSLDKSTFLGKTNSKRIVHFKSLETIEIFENLFAHTLWTAHLR